MVVERPAEGGGRGGEYGCINVTKAANGVLIPLPTQPGMVSNCNEFVRANPGDTCDITPSSTGPSPLRTS